MIDKNFLFLNIISKQKDDFPTGRSGSVPASPTEQIVRKDMDKLNENMDEIKKLKEEISNKNRKK